MEEIEGKFLGIDIEEIEQKLRALGAQFIGEKFMRSTIFDYDGFTLDAKLAWLRLRTDGTVTTLAFKQRLGANESGNDTGMLEIETEVQDFKTMEQIMLSLGMIVKFSNEKKRRSWEKDGVMYDIDTWPRLDPYLEIEASSWEEVDEGARALGLDPNAKLICSTTQIYEQAGIRDKDFIKMTFNEWVPRSKP